MPGIAARPVRGAEIFRGNRKKVLAFFGEFCYYNGRRFQTPHDFQWQGGAVMAKCDICGKGVTFGIKVSHSHRRSNRAWKPNVKRVKAIVDGTPRHVYVCTRCLRSNKVERAI